MLYTNAAPLPSATSVSILGLPLNKVEKPFIKNFLPIIITGIHKIICVNANPKGLDNQVSVEDLDNLEKTPDRRGWVRVSEIISGKEVLKPSHKSMIAGIIGGVAANRFFEFLDKNHIVTAKEQFFGVLFERVLW